ncbi:Nacht domain [Fusarium albosuccineum]|uniref:Nacht domain n=1 Tax=Fusarium albosuccineum TaxID=1237068 RepID=A0A8H4KY03_9HYPO|nr:Nacht domain [Fusarium albosuccineum]
MNHQELASKISEAFTAIGDALPEVDFLASQLYPVPRIQSTLATIYTHIIDFCIRALTWYRKTRGNFLRKTLAAIKDPWALEFDEVVRQIQRAVARIREQAAVAHQAETRHISYMMSEVRTEVMNIRKERNMESSLLNNMPSIANTVLSPSNQPSILGKVPLVIKVMSKYFSSVPFQPEKALVLGAAVRDRRRARGHPVSDQLWTSIKLRNWISKPGSALVQVKGTLATADASRDFALDMIELAKAVGLPLAWCVSSQLPSTSSARSIKVEDIWRSLLWQVLEKNSDGSSYRNLAESDFASCSNEDDWITLLVAVLAEMSHVVLVIDCHQEERGIRETVGKFWRTVTEQKAKTTVKMLLLTYSNPGTSMPVILPSEDVQLYTVALGQDRRPGMARALLQGNPRGRRQVVARRGGGASQLRPFMAKLLEDGGNAADKAS